MKALSKIVELKDINKFYKVGKEKVHILKSINLNIEKGEFVMIMGKSGSGKTTLLNILGFLDKFDEGEYIFNNQDVTRLNESERSNFRNLNIGFIFQQFNLINTLNIYQNVELPMIYNNKYSKQEKKEQIENKLSIVELLDKIKQQNTDKIIKLKLQNIETKEVKVYPVEEIKNGLQEFIRPICIVCLP